MFRGADAGAHQDRRRREGACGEDDEIGLEDLPRGEPNADHSPVLDHDAVDKRVGAQLEREERARDGQIRDQRRLPDTVARVARLRARAGRARRVLIGLVAEHREQRLIHRARDRLAVRRVDALDVDRSPVSVIRPVAELLVGLEAAHGRQARVPRPFRDPPAIEIGGLRAHRRRGVRSRRAADALPTGQLDIAITFAAKAPVVLVDGDLHVARQQRRRVGREVRSCLEEQDARAPLCEPRRNDRAGGTCADDDRVVPRHVRASTSSRRPSRSRD